MLGQILVTRRREIEVISRYHDSPAAGHWGISRTTSMVKRNYVCKGMMRKVREYVRTCDICQRWKADTHLPRGKMGHLEIPVRKWESVSVDFISLPETTSRSSDVMVDEILTVTDRATKMVVLIPCGSRWNAAEVADNF